MKQRNVALLAMALALGACASDTVETRPVDVETFATPSGIDGTDASKVTRLTLGMTRDEVAGILGGHQRDLTVAPLSCRSYLYLDGEDTKLVHVYFRDGKVIAASDGHTAYCSLSKPE